MTVASDLQKSVTINDCKKTLNVATQNFDSINAGDNYSEKSLL